MLGRKALNAVTSRLFGKERVPGTAEEEAARQLQRDEQALKDQESLQRNNDITQAIEATQDFMDGPYR